MFNAACSQQNLRLGALGALLTLTGAVLSGPVAVLLVESWHPQPVWQNARLFADNYHPIQTLPYLLGLVLVSGLLVLVCGVHGCASDAMKARSSVAVALSASFAALIAFNYIVQTTFLPALTSNYDDEYGAIIASFTMANPQSLGWAIEMWGYALIGLSTWLVAPVFGGSRLASLTRIAFIANGPVSIAGGVFTTWKPGWVVTRAGYGAFALWNLLLMTMAALALYLFYQALRAKALLACERPANQAIHG